MTPVLSRELGTYGNIAREQKLKFPPLDQIAFQLADMTTNTEISTNNIEPEPDYVEALRPTKTKPEYWTGLGASNTRSSEQIVASRNIIHEMITECAIDTTIIFTDGSCLGNPGPCGAGACIYPPKQLTQLI